MTDTEAPDAANMVNSPAIDQAYDEVMSLLIEAKAFASQYRQHGEGLEPDKRLRLSHYTMQVTARLTQVMAWLMANKAVAAGELPPSVLKDETYALPEEGSLPGTDPDQEAREADDLATMPGQLETLMSRSKAIYRRISRLDQELRAAG